MHKVKFLLSPKSFTLVELINSIAIIGILAAVVISQYKQYKIRAWEVLG
jgi:prepilin-type N-terminal cleavage/methylation domain-containing protein